MGVKTVKVKNCFMKNEAFSLVELMVIIAILAIALVISLPVFVSFDRGYKLNNATELLIEHLQAAREKSLALEGAGRYGIYFDISSSPQKYVLYKGVGYSMPTRNTSFDVAYYLPDAVEIEQASFNGVPEVIFRGMTGIVDNPGSATLRLKSDISKVRTVYVDSFGQVSAVPIPVLPDENRIKDARHIHVSYNRMIDYAVENLVLSFNGGTTVVNIPVVSNFQGGQITWEGEVDVDGDIQKIKIQTQIFNNPDTLFCIHRDGRYNNKSLTVSLSADASGSLAEYSADGSGVSATSIYASNLTAQ